MRNSFYLIISLLFLNSCAFHSGMMTSSAALTDGNFQVVDVATGEAVTTHVLGIGGLMKQAIIKEAKIELLRNYPLKKGQVLANVTVDFKRSFYVVFMTTKATVSADIVQFTVQKNNNEFDALNAAYYPVVESTMANFNLGDSVYVMIYKTPKSAEVTGLTTGKIQVNYKEDTSSISSRVFRLKDVYHRKPSPQNRELYGFDVNDSVMVKLITGDTIKAQIFGINSYKAGVKYNLDYMGHFKWEIVPLMELRKPEEE